MKGYDYEQIKAFREWQEDAIIILMLGQIVLGLFVLGWAGYDILVKLGVLMV